MIFEIFTVYVLSQILTNYSIFILLDKFLF